MMPSLVRRPQTEKAVCPRKNRSSNTRAGSAYHLRAGSVPVSSAGTSPLAGAAWMARIGSSHRRPKMKPWSLPAARRAASTWVETVPVEGCSAGIAEAAHAQAASTSASSRVFIPSPLSVQVRQTIAVSPALLGQLLAGLLRQHFDPVAPDLLVAFVRQQMSIRHLRPATRQPDWLGVEVRVGHGHLGDEHPASLRVGAIKPVALDDNGLVGMRRGALVQLFNEVVGFDHQHLAFPAPSGIAAAAGHAVLLRDIAGTEVDAARLTVQLVDDGDLLGSLDDLQRITPGTEEHTWHACSEAYAAGRVAGGRDDAVEGFVTLPGFGAQRHRRRGCARGGPVACPVGGGPDTREIRRRCSPGCQRECGEDGGAQGDRRFARKTKSVHVSAPLLLQSSVFATRKPR